MRQEKLFELLGIVNGVTISKWNMVMQLVDLIAKGESTVQEKKWRDPLKEGYPRLYPLNLDDIKTWSTHDNTCIDLYFTVNSTNEFKCKVKIYDGDTFDGCRKGLRFEALLALPSSFIHKIEGKIEWAFEEFLEDEYERHLKAQKILWIDNLKETILNR